MCKGSQMYLYHKHFTFGLANALFLSIKFCLLLNNLKLQLYTSLLTINGSTNIKQTIKWNKIIELN